MLRSGAFALAGLVAMLAWSPVADGIATRLVAAPPTLGAFAALQRSWRALLLGIAVAWALGGVLEEVLLRGVVVRGLYEALPGAGHRVPAAAVGVVVAASCAYVVHLYQGARAALVVAQLSVILGVVYLVAGQDLPAVILCHGTFDTIAFARFARGTSRYAPPAG